MKISREDISPKFIEEVSLLVTENDNETGAFPWSRIRPNWPMYVSANEAGYIELFTARDEEKLIGYATFAVTPHIQHCDILCATQDTLFISRAHRKGMAGIKFIKFIEMSLLADGVEVIIQGTNEKRNLQPLFSRMGYEVFEVKMMKRLHYGT